MPVAIDATKDEISPSVKEVRRKPLPFAKGLPACLRWSSSASRPFLVDYGRREIERDSISLPKQSLSRLMKKGVQRGLAPLAGAWGCPPDTNPTPFLARKGVRGMVERVFQQPARGAPPLLRGAPSIHFFPFPRWRRGGRPILAARDGALTGKEPLFSRRNQGRQQIGRPWIPVFGMKSWTSLIRASTPAVGPPNLPSRIGGPVDCWALSIRRLCSGAQARRRTPLVSALSWSVVAWG